MFELNKKTLKVLIAFAAVFAVVVIGFIVYANFSPNSKSSLALPTDLKCSEKELKKYKVQTTYPITKEDKPKNLGKGWADSEAAGTWAVGESSTFYYYLDEVDPATKRYFVTIEFSDTMGYHNKFYVNGVELGEIELPKNLGSMISTKTASFIIPSDVVKPGVNTFAIITEDKLSVVPHRHPAGDFKDDRYNVLVNSLFVGYVEKGVI